MDKPEIICIGEVLWDSMPEGLFLGGAPFNVACHLHMLGKPVKMISRIGDDELGNQVLRRLNMKNMSTELIQTDNEHPTGIVNVNLEAVDNPGYDIVYPVAWDFISADDKNMDAARSAGVAIYGSLGQRHEVSRRTIRKTLSQDATGVFDINLRPPYDDKQIVEETLKKSKIVKLNDGELKRLCDWFDLPAEPESACRALCRKFSCDTVCITRGGQGAALLHREEWNEHSGYRVEVKDTVGSGDAFLAGLLIGILDENTNHEILNYANALGAFVAGKSGATPKLDRKAIAGLIQSED